MNNARLRTYSYRCSCGYEVRVFLDSGIPQESWKCRRCGEMLNRREY